VDWGRRFQEALQVAHAALTPESMAAAVAAGRRALAQPGGAVHREDLGGLLYTRFLHGGGDLADLREARALERAVLAESPEDDFLMGNLAHLVHTLFKQTREPADLAEALSLARRAVALDPHCPAHRRMLSMALRSQFTLTGELDKLVEAVELSRLATELPDDQEDPGHYPYSFSLVLVDWYDATGDLAVLAESIAAARVAVARTQVGAEVRIDRQQHLCALLYDRWQRTRRPQDKAELVGAEALVAAIAPPGHPARASAERNLRVLTGGRLASSGPDQAELLAGGCVQRIARFKQTGELEVLVEGIALGSVAVATSTANTSRRASHLDTLGTALLEHAMATGGDLTDALALHRQAVALEPHPRHQANLSATLVTLFARTGEFAVLEQAIESARAAVAQLPNAANLGMLAICLSHRHNVTGELAVLEEAIAVAREATRQDEDDLAHHLGTLATLLSDWYDRTGDARVLRESVEVHQAVVRGLPTHHPGRAQHLGNLGGVQHELFVRFGDEAALRASIAAHRAAVSLTADDDPARPGHLANLSVALQSHGDEEAVAIARLAARGGEDFGRAYRLGVLGGALRWYYQRTGDREALTEALHTLRAAAKSKQSPVEARLRAAMAGGELAADAGLAEEAAVGLSTAVGLLPRLASRRLGRGDAQFWLSRFTGLAATAATCALTAGSPAGAVVLLEVGRGVLAAQALDARSDLTDLPPKLAERFTAVSEAIETEANADRMALAAEFDAVLAQIRAIPELAGFLRQPSITELTAVADEGPVVLVNTSRFRCDALIVTTEGVRSVPLPDLSEDELRRRVTAFHTALAERDHRTREQAVLDTLAWLWHAVAGPVLDALGFTEPQESPLPRLWWSPIGLLALLPLHAAGMVNGPWVGERVISSCTPTIRALKHARRNAADAQPRLLAVAMPTTPNAPDLPNAEAEASAASRRLSGTLLSGEAATRTAVLEALTKSTWAHFACHGYADPANPSNSRLVLANTPLHVQDISRLRLTDAQFVFLSACDTARTALTLSDEAIHLAAAFQIAGFRHVVGTLWAVHDGLAPQVAAEVYDALLEGAADPRRSAAALHETQAALRSAFPNLPSLWATYVHSGA
jgi:tetratricopeptide (TPR) repeat protein